MRGLKAQLVAVNVKRYQSSSPAGSSVPVKLPLASWATGTLVAVVQAFGAPSSRHSQPLANARSWSM